MAIEITAHARERMKIYGVSEEQVSEAVLKPDSTIGGYKGRKIAQKRLNSFVLRVIYEEIGSTKLVITTYKAKRERYEI